MIQNRNVIYLLALAAAVVVGAMGYQAYLDSREPKGVEIKVGPQGLSIREN